MRAAKGSQPLALPIVPCPENQKWWSNWHSTPLSARFSVPADMLDVPNTPSAAWACPKKTGLARREWARWPEERPLERIRTLERGMTMTNENVTLPLLPLTSGVVLPGMVFTMALESNEARVAVDAARSAGGHLLLVPHIEGRYASVGVIAEVLEEGSLPGGLEAIAIRGDQRATIGTGVPGTGEALWVEAEPIEEGDATPAALELAREYRAVLEKILLSRGARQVAAQLRDVTEPGRLADVAGYSPDLSLAQKVEVLETLDVETRLRLVLGWARDTLADLTLRERIKSDVEEGMEKRRREFLLRRQLESIRKELGEIGSGDGDEPDDYRA